MKTTNKIPEIIKNLNNHKDFIIDFLRLIKNYTYKRYNIDIKNCDEFINIWNTQLINDKAIMEAFYYGDDIISIIEKMKNDEPINYNILNDNIKNFKYDESYFDKFFDKYNI